MSYAARPVLTSIFELFKAGPGPSSSHTIGPMLAALDFRQELQALPPEKVQGAAAVRVRLLGSLSATGFGHGTAEAIVTGLLGHKPDSCPANLPAGVFSLTDDDRTLVLGQARLILTKAVVVYDKVEHGYPHSNTLIFELSGPQGLMYHKTYYSVGGGFIQWDGWQAPEKGRPPYPYATAEELHALVHKQGLSIPQIMLHNEMALSGMDADQVYEQLDAIIAVMRRSVERGINAEGVLPGTLGVYRKAAHLARKAAAVDSPVNRFVGLLNAYAFAVSEENAAGGIIVTAPTCGAAGVIPAILSIIEGPLGLGQEAVRGGMLAAAAVGFLAKHNAHIAGAEVGCQGEVGVASAMAAAMLAQARGYPARIVENAAEIALEHHLGLTCDPVGGYVQIPCIERNAMGALKAYNACLVASMEDPERHRVTLDAAIRAMAETGRDMNAKYKETSLGGLAVSIVEC